MNDPSVRLGDVALDDLLKDAGIIRIVTGINTASISILELLEYGVTRPDVNRAFAKGVIRFDSSLAGAGRMEVGGSAFERAAAAYDEYFRFLSSKVKLTELGIFILETIEAGSHAHRIYEPVFKQETAEIHFSIPDSGPALPK